MHVFLMISQSSSNYTVFSFCSSLNGFFTKFGQHWELGFCDWWLPPPPIKIDLSDDVACTCQNKKKNSVRKYGYGFLVFKVWCIQGFGQCAYTHTHSDCFSVCLHSLRRSLLPSQQPLSRSPRRLTLPLPQPLLLKLSRHGRKKRTSWMQRTSSPRCPRSLNRNTSIKKVGSACRDCGPDTLGSTILIAIPVLLTKTRQMFG